MNNSMRSGYIILELLIAFAISSIVIGALFTTFNQTRQAVTIIDRIASIDMRTLLLQSQLERDLSGAFVPQECQKKASEKKILRDDPSASSGSPQDDRGREKDKKKIGQKQECKNIPLKKAFFGKHKGQNLEFLTFITTNLLPSYDVLKPRLARVIYKIVPERQQARGDAKPSFRLLRQEHEMLCFAEFEKKKVRPYEVIKNIKRFSVEYVVAIKKEQETKDKFGKAEKTKKETQEPRMEYKIFKKWGPEEIKQTKKQKPDICKFSIELWDELRKTFKSFEFDIYMALGVQESKKPKKEKKKPDQGAKGEKEKKEQ